jgi:hypothetical protein
MPLTRRPDEPAEPLSPDMATLLLHGPQAIGKTEHDFPHDTLRALWAVHGPALLASKGCPKKPWFLERDWFVTYVRRELL